MVHVAKRVPGQSKGRAEAREKTGGKTRWGYNKRPFRLRGKGVPQVRSSYTGDLVVRVRVEVPTRLNEKQKEILRQFDSASTGKEYKERKTFLDKMKDLFN